MSQDAKPDTDVGVVRAAALLLVNDEGTPYQ